MKENLIERAYIMLGHKELGAILTDMSSKIEVIMDTLEATNLKEDFYESALDVCKTYVGMLNTLLCDAEARRYDAMAALTKVLQEPEAVEFEGKQDIADALVPALRLTRAGDNVEKIVINNGIAEVYRINGSTLPVNIKADSGIAMIIDICKALM